MCMLLLCLGAEQAQEIYNHVREQTQKHLDSYARDGLRTLCIAKKVVLQGGETKCFCAVLSRHFLLSHISSCHFGRNKWDTYTLQANRHFTVNKPNMHAVFF